jgi:hypothetical protein
VLHLLCIPESTNIYIYYFICMYIRIHIRIYMRFTNSSTYSGIRHQPNAISHFLYIYIYAYTYTYIYIHADFPNIHICMYMRFTNSSTASTHIYIHVICTRMYIHMCFTNSSIYIYGDRVNSCMYIYTRHELRHRGLHGHAAPRSLCAYVHTHTY